MVIQERSCSTLLNRDQWNAEALTCHKSSCFLEINLFLLMKLAVKARITCAGLYSSGLLFHQKDKPVAWFLKCRGLVSEGSGCYLVWVINPNMGQALTSGSWHRLQVLQHSELFGFIISQ